jgi:hypothetical protein
LIAAVLHNVGTLAVMANAARLLRFDETGTASGNGAGGFVTRPEPAAGEGECGGSRPEAEAAAP